jgi:hypothetical protein
MVTYVGQAIAWGLSRMLRLPPPSEPVAHRDLEHAHWDPVARRWLTHPDDQQATAGRAA